MLRRWPHRELSSAMPVAQRAFWSQAMTIISRLKCGDTDAHADKKVVTVGTQDKPCTSKWEANSAWCPRACTDAECPTFLENAGSDQVDHAKKVFSDFALHLRRISDPIQLMQSWNVVRQCRPFIVDCDGLRFADGDKEAGDNKTEAATGMLQMVPADVFAQRVAGTNRRTLFVGSTLLHNVEERVTAANEAVVVAVLVEFFYALGEHEKTIEFFESYTRDRLNWLKERSTVATDVGAAAPALEVLSSSVDEGEQKKLSGFVATTHLNGPALTAYFKSLQAKNRYHKIVQFAREDMLNLEATCESVETMLTLLISCCKANDSKLARIAIDTISKQNPVLVLPLSSYELALKAALWNQRRDESDLDNALWVARVMHDDAGYVLHPDLWFTLFNTSLHQKRGDSALEVFDLCSSNFNSLKQDHFRRALRKACRLNHPDVVLAMVRQWLAAVDGSAYDVDMESKTKVLDFVLWEMLCSDHPLAAVTEMLAIMNSSQIATGGNVLQRVVMKILDDTAENLSPRETIKSSLEFWKMHASAVKNSVYLMYLLVQYCLKHGWLDECELVVNEIAERRLPGVPGNSVAKVMNLNEERGRFEDNVRMCETLLKSLPRPGFKTLNQQFFEGYLKALVCLGRFDDVCEQHARLKLGQRFRKSMGLAAALHNAEAQRV